MQAPLGVRMEEAIDALLKADKTPEQIYKALCEQTVDLVFTAHPTQAMRESVRTKYDQMLRQLIRLHAPNTELRGPAREELEESIKMLIAAAWCAVYC